MHSSSIRIILTTWCAMWWLCACSPSEPGASSDSSLSTMSEPDAQDVGDAPADQDEDEAANAAQQLDPKVAAEARRTLIAWLECEECTEGQLEAVLALGNKIVPSLSAALLRGPSPASVEALRLHLEDRYDALVEYRKTHPEIMLPYQKQQYVDRYLDKYRALYQIRSATALGKIGGPAALRALQQADQMDFRDDVDKAIDEALVELQ